MSKHPAVADTVLRPANAEQYRQSLVNQYPQWGTGYSLDGFIEREHHLGQTGMGKQMQCWVLVPTDDPETKDILCSCETFRRPVIWCPRAGVVKDAVAYSIASVFTPPHNRGKRYASHMMSTLHSKLRLDKQIVNDNIPSVSDNASKGQDAVVSFLFSDVGDFYASCGPPGWHSQGLSTTVWQLDGYPADVSISSSLSAVKAQDFKRVADADARIVRDDVASKGPYPAFAVVLTEGTLDWTTTRATEYARQNNLPEPQIWGFETGSSLILFSYELKRQTVKVLRVRADCANVLEQLLDGVAAVARELGANRIVAWQVDETLVQGLPSDKQGKTADRTDSLSALAEYAGEGEIAWRINEACFWC
ncbi:hypothetical protein OIV83_003978 [Microbotryomycetes sp. JL201]|nr:hypothetical protein OIV83_003978 [Microbotryomycetes sp. JL201]